MSLLRRLCAGLSALLACAPLAAAPSCDFADFPAGSRQLGRWINQGNWLVPGNRRAGLLAGEVFMPGRRLAADGADSPAAPAGDFAKLVIEDPLDDQPRSVDFLLDSRLQADGLLIIRNGRIAAERYRNGLQATTPRLLLDATRPWLNLLGAIAIGQGKLTADQAVARALTTRPSSPALRKLSVQRLLDSPGLYEWTPAEFEGWQRAAGWTTTASGGMRSWLSERLHNELPPLRRAPPQLPVPSPEDELLARLLGDAYDSGLARIFCEQLLSRHRPEHPVIWLSDPQGDELADGLGISLRDFARLGQTMLEARVSRSKIPGWLIETLTAAAPRSAEVAGLPLGSEVRYGFVHLGGRPNRVALIGAQGASLYLDFDRRLVIAIYASHPAGHAPLTLATLEALWRRLAEN